MMFYKRYTWNDIVDIMLWLNINTIRHVVKINILRHVVKNKYITSFLFVTSLSPPLPIAPRGGGGNDPGVGLKTVYVHDTGTSGVMTSLPVGKNASNLQEFTIMTSLPVCDVTSGRTQGNGILLAL